MSTTEETFLRKLSHSHKQKLSRILDIQNAWESFAARIPTKPDLLFQPEEEWVPRYDTAHIQTFRAMNGSPTRNLLDDWGTRNVRLKHLVQVLRLTNLGHAANIIDQDILRKPREELPKPLNSVTKSESSSEHKNPPISETASGNNHNSDLNSTMDSSSEAYIIDALNHLPSIDSELSERLSYNSETFGVEFGNTKNALAIPVEENMSHIRLDESHKSPSGSNEARIIQQDRGMNSMSTSGSPVQALSDLLSTKPTTQVDRGWASARGTDINPGKDPTQSHPDVKSLPEPPCNLISTENSSTQNEFYENQVLLSCGKDLREIPFNLLRAITDNFNTVEDSKGGRLIGEGGFGFVFLGLINNTHRVAVKCLKDNTEDTKKQFLVEIKTLSAYRHANLVHLIGYSLYGSQRCLVYEYMVNGSLEDRLACKDNTQPLTCKQRLLIVEGTACGIEFLHQNNLVHRDIKSANILLDDNLIPKVGDFATARATSSDMTTKIIGTQVYLAPEALSGQIHIGLDCYSFGVVLLEILTGLPVLDINRQNHDLKTFVHEYLEEGDDDDEDDEDDDNGVGRGKSEPGTIFDLLDARAGQWMKQSVDLLFGVSNRCLDLSMKKRAKMKQVVRWLEAGVVGK